jgi:hypothetical protein
LNKERRTKPRITESEWLKAKTVIDLDLYRSAWQQHRKWRLFGVACCRQALLLVPEPRLEPLADAADRFADGRLTWEQMKKHRKVLAAIRRELGDSFGPDEAKHDLLKAFEHATDKTPISTLSADHEAQYVSAALSRPKFDAGMKRAEKKQVALARDIFGNPFRQVKLPRKWRTSTAVALARQMYESRDFGAMPILADALQDAGCDSGDILSHCRDTSLTHVRGCWVVDLVLCKS